MKSYILEYANENEFKKLERGLKKYNMLAYKKLNFEYYPNLRNGEFVGNLIDENKPEHIKKYELELPADKMIIQVHGEVKLIYTVYEKEGTVILEKITPEHILIEGHNSELHTYKGIMISSSDAMKDKFKIDLLNKLQGK